MKNRGSGASAGSKVIVQKRTSGISKPKITIVGLSFGSRTDVDSGNDIDIGFANRVRRDIDGLTIGPGIVLPFG